MIDLSLHLSLLIFHFIGIEFPVIIIERFYDGGNLL